MTMPNCINNVKFNISMVARNLKSGRKRHSRKLLYKTDCSSQMDVFHNFWS